MKNFKKTILAIALFAVITNNVSAGAAAGVIETPSIMSGITSAITSGLASVGSSALKGAYSLGKRALSKGALPIAGTALASTILPFGLGTVAQVAIPYLIAAGADIIKDKFSGHSQEEKQLLLMRALKRANKRLAKIRHQRRRSRYFDFELDGLGLDDLDDDDDYDYYFDEDERDEYL